MGKKINSAKITRSIKDFEAEFAEHSISVRMNYEIGRVDLLFHSIWTFYEALVKKDIAAELVKHPQAGEGSQKALKIEIQIWRREFEGFHSFVEEMDLKYNTNEFGSGGYLESNGFKIVSDRFSRRIKLLNESPDSSAPSVSADKGVRAEKIKWLGTVGQLGALMHGLHSKGLIGEGWAAMAANHFVTESGTLLDAQRVRSDYRKLGKASGKNVDSLLDDIS